jgi:hypothetical protein
MAVVPERARLVVCRERVKERVARGNGALRHERYAVRPAVVGLEEAVPMLESMGEQISKNRSTEEHTMLVLSNIVSFVSESMTLRLNSSPCAKRKIN